MTEETEDSDPGGTPVFRATYLERLFAFKKIFLKFEGVNPSGTHKDRAAYSHIKYAIRKGHDTITVGTCGNYGVAFSLYSRLNGMRTQVFVPERYHSSKVRLMRENGALVSEIPGTYEDSVERSRNMATDNGWYDANPGLGSSAISFSAYSKISYEIFQQFGRAPDAISVPVGNGTTLVGIHKGFLDLRRRGLIDRIPRILGASTTGGNPVVRAFKKGGMITDIDPDVIRESNLNEPLVASHAYDGELALKAVKNTDGYAEYISDSRMMYYRKIISRESGINVLPASTAPLEAIRKAEKYPEENLYVAVITGRT